MAGYNLKLSVKGALETQRHLRQLGTHTQHAQAALEKGFREVVLPAEREFWATARWKPLAASTVKAKARKGLDPRTLRATGALESSFTELGAPHQVKEVTDDYLRFGTNLFYAHFHQDPRQSEPKRKLLQMGRVPRRQFAQTVLDHIIQSVY